VEVFRAVDGEILFFASGGHVDSPENFLNLRFSVNFVSSGRVSLFSEPTFFSLFC